MLKVLDLFSGIGGFSLGLERTGGFKTVAFCEIDPFCRKVLAKHWPGVPIYEDVRTINEHLTADGVVFDVLTGGYPCQPFSHAGKRRGEEDDRNLWPAMFEVIKGHRPTWVIGENTFGHVSLGLDNVLSDLERLGYACQAIVIPACAVESHQRRERVWILAHAVQGQRSLGRNASGMRRQPKQISWHGMGEKKASPRVVGKFDGIPNGLDRITRLGNAVVPQITEMLGHAILEAEAA